VVQKKFEIGDKVELIRPSGTFTKMIGRGSTGIVTDVSDKGNLWVDDWGWLDQSFVKKI